MVNFSIEQFVGILHTERMHPTATFVAYTVIPNGVWCEHCEREKHGLPLRQIGDPPWHVETEAVQ